MNLYSPSLVGAATGIGTHVFLYRFGEWDQKSLSIFLSYVVLGMLAFASEWSEVVTIHLSHRWALRTIIWHILGVYASMCFYRVFLHRLNRFPGPLIARLSNLYPTFLSAKKVQLFKETEKLHRRFGDYVRLGPTELSVIDPEAIAAIYGTQATTSKGPWYEILNPRVSMVNERDKKAHARRRKVWDQGMSSKALRGYEQRVLIYADQLTKAVEHRVGTSIDMTKWFHYFATDVMGDLSFGRPFGLLTERGGNHFLTLLQGTMKNIGLLGHMIWIIPFFMAAPGIDKQIIKFWDFVGMKVNERIDNEPEVPDLFSWLLEDYMKGPRSRQDNLNLHGDAFIIVVAGSDTTAAVLTNLFYYLSINPEIREELQCEIDQMGEISDSSLLQLNLLDAVINETMRLYPVVPSGLQRQTPPEGLRIGNVYIPGNVIVQTPLYTVFRDERNFERPTEFIPSRWTTQPDLVKNKNVFIPFNSGLYQCVGKRLAFMEMRFVTAKLLKRFDFSLAPEQSQEAFIEGMRDNLTLGTAPLQLLWRRRDSQCGTRCAS